MAPLMNALARCRLLLDLKVPSIHLKTPVTTLYFLSNSDCRALAVAMTDSVACDFAYTRIIRKKSQVLGILRIRGLKSCREIDEPGIAE